MIIFRCDAGSDVGLGHLMRCRTLAGALKSSGHECTMVGPDLSFSISGDDHIFIDWIKMDGWGSELEDAQRLISTAKKVNADFLVLDDYRIGREYQLDVRKSGLSWLQFDSSADNPLWADLVLNANPSIQRTDYNGIIQNSEAMALLGPEYSLLRPEFQRLPKKVKSDNRRWKILITFGGGDDCGAIIFSLSALLSSMSETLEFNVLVGAHNPNISDLRDWVEIYGDGRVSLHIDPPNVSSVFADCDLAVMAGGTSTFEAACCGLPMVIIGVADNQIPQSKAWDDLGVAIFLGMIDRFNPEELIRAVSKICSLAEHKKRSEKARSLVDGKGAQRVAGAIINLLPRCEVQK